MTVRGAAAIGAGLAPARPARPIAPGERIHVVGVAGAGASAAALLASWAGGRVDGCDPGGEGQYTPALHAAGITVLPRHDAAHVTGALPPARLAVTKALTAIEPDHPELVAARDAGIPLEPWQQVVADAAAGRRLVAVAGTHGKSTSAGWLVHVLSEGGLDPGAFVGALLPAGVTGIGVPATARRGRGLPFVVEADEYAGNFDAYRPSLIVLTSAEWDHPDVFADRAAVLAAFETWIRAAADPRTGGVPEPVLVANVADAGVDELVRNLRDWPGRIVATSLRNGDEVRPSRAELGPSGARIRGRIVDAAPAGTRLAISGLDPRDGDATVEALIPLAGRHNAANALGVAGAASVLGMAPEAIAAGLASFPGVGRRLERKGDARGVVVYDDYGHHPTAIRETLAAVRQREPGRRVWAVYEPLTYHRTAALLDAFAEVLAAADAVAIADIWAGRDPDTTVASALGLAAAIKRRAPGIVAEAPGSVEATAGWLAGHVRSGDVVLVMGGGRSYRIGELLLQQLGGGG
jgi:UDP-N-acetylmuramate--alanine ligase